MGIRGIIRDIIFLYLGYRLIRIWLFKAEFTAGVGILLIVLMLVSVWFLIERIGVIPQL